MITEEQLKPVLTPLCAATETLFEPLDLREHDFLEVSLNEEGDRFIVQSQTYYTPHNGEMTVDVNGTPMVKGRSAGSFNASYHWVKRCPERKELGQGKWLLAATDFSALVMYHCWPNERLIFTESALLQYKLLTMRFLLQSRASVLAANFKVNNETPDMPSDYIEHPLLPLSNYQKVALLASLNQEAYGLFMDRGTGKTAVVIARICLEAKRLRLKISKMYRALVICPNQVRLNWEVECSRFATSPGKTAIMRGGRYNRQKALIDCVRDEKDCEWSCCILSMDSVASSMELLSKIPWDLIIVDESHCIKNPSSKRFKTMRKLTNSRQRMILTGTPIANYIFDLWSQLEFLGRGLSGFLTYANFKGFHGKFTNIKSGGNSIQKLIGIKGLPLIQERLARMTFIISKKEANLGLPDKVFDLEEVDMTVEQSRIYDKLAKDLLVEIQERLDEAELAGKYEMTVTHVLTMLLRLAQITSGHVKTDMLDDGTPGRVLQIPGGNPKVDAVVGMLIDETRDPKGKTIIWCTFVEDMRILSERLSKEGIKHVGYHRVIDPRYRVSSADAAERIMNTDDDCRVFIGNPASAGTGLNILGYDRENPEESEMYCDHQIYFSSNWSMIQRAQSEDRCHRRGTRSNVRVTDLVIPGTIDEEIRARVLAKGKKALVIQDIRQILESLV